MTGPEEHRWTRRRSRSSWPAALAAAVVLLSACTGSSPRPGPPETAACPSPATVPGASLLPACPTALPTFDLATFKSLLAQLHGTPVVVNVWASWCGPCIQEAPELAAASAAHRGRVQFLGVDIQDHGPAATAFIERFGWSYPSVSDPSAAIRDGLGLIGQPNTIFYDRTGKRVHVVSGPVTAQILAAELAKILQA